MTPATASPRRLVAGFGLLLLVGCGTTPSPRLFTLAPRSETPARQLSATVGVKRVEIAKYLDRPQIVAYSDAYELKLSEFTLWGEGLGDMTTRVLAENLSERLTGSQVYVAAGPLDGQAAEITLEVSIDRFEPDPAGVVVLAGQWVAHREGHDDQLRSEQIRVTPASGDATGQVAAMSDALGQFADRIAAGLPPPDEKRARRN
ncbi:MAG: membrane integrity-associated transporter subunit PqiC [Stellaceae bacterium]